MLFLTRYKDTLNYGITDGLSPRTDFLSYSSCLRASDNIEILTYCGTWLLVCGRRKSDIQFIEYRFYSRWYSRSVVRYWFYSFLFTAIFTTGRIRSEFPCINVFSKRIGPLTTNHIKFRNANQGLVTLQRFDAVVNLLVNGNAKLCSHSLKGLRHVLSSSYDNRFWSTPKFDIRAFNWAI